VELAVRLGEGRVARRERALARRRPVAADVVVNRYTLERLDERIAVVIADGLLVVGRVVFRFFLFLLCCDGKFLPLRDAPRSSLCSTASMRLQLMLQQPAKRIVLRRLSASD